MRDRENWAAWEARNAVKITVKINRNQDPELYALFENAESRGGLARELMQEALEARKAKLEQLTGGKA